MAVPLYAGDSFTLESRNQYYSLAVHVQPLDQELTRYSARVTDLRAVPRYLGSSGVV